ncbi:hypothetical protein PGTUg99_017487 [Puccinia graminis f. sp. tritici]|uniref:Uncharacterized protein n=1 Tax=Puccinia graminis f. sp. tritici TaxID=56615 RepID=A0A5B0Q1D8_PUCGR|nr:hypothetical protein PGTUg99_017487 [Puccinia graminis f. sp. tritici]
MMINIILLVGMVAFLSITQSNAYNCDNAFQRIPNTPNSVACQNGLEARKCDLDQCITYGPYGPKPREKQSSNSQNLLQSNLIHGSM